MLTFNLEDGKQVQLDREAVEEKLLMAIFDAFEKGRSEQPGIYNFIKSTLSTMKTFGFIDVQVPKGENILEYYVAHFMTLGLDVLEQKPLPVSGKIIDLTPEAPQEEAAQDGKTE